MKKINGLTISQIKEASKEISFDKSKELYKKYLTEIIEEVDLEEDSTVKQNVFMLCIGYCIYYMWHSLKNHKWYLA